MDDRAGRKGDPERTSLEEQRQLGGVTGKGFMPGRSGNPGGRPRQFAGYIREATGEGKALVDFMLNVQKLKPVEVTVVRGDGPPVKLVVAPTLDHAMEATKWLADRGWGRSVQAVDIRPPTPFVVQHRHFPPGHDPLADRNGVLGAQGSLRSWAPSLGCPPLTGRNSP